MSFNKHSDLEGRHAFMGASNYHWINDDDDKIRERWRNAQAVARGTKLHAFAKDAILLKQKLPKTNQTLCKYVNDAIGYGLTPEQVLMCSYNAFGTADAIGIGRNGLLRIHDLKTGRIPAHMEQLEIYAAFYCLEYGIKPTDIEMELRIYQNDEVAIENPDPEDIQYIMNKTVHNDKIIEDLKEREG